MMSDGKKYVSLVLLLVQIFFVEIRLAILRLKKKEKKFRLPLRGRVEGRATKKYFFAASLSS